MQEVRALKKITELRKHGLWSMRRIPKSHEPPRMKTHWDYVMEEMQWLANDFAQERKMKRTCSKKVCSKSCSCMSHALIVVVNDFRFLDL